jgi:hypothetical protein
MLSNPIQAAGVILAMCLSPIAASTPAEGESLFIEEAGFESDGATKGIHHETHE